MFLYSDPDPIDEMEVSNIDNEEAKFLLNHEDQENNVLHQSSSQRRNVDGELKVFFHLAKLAKSIPRNCKIFKNNL